MFLYQLTRLDSSSPVVVTYGWKTTPRDIYNVPSLHLSVLQTLSYLIFTITPQSRYAIYYIHSLGKEIET